MPLVTLRLATNRGVLFCLCRLHTKLLASLVPCCAASMQSKSASDMISPAIPDLVSDMFVVYINFAVEKQLVSRLVSLFLLLDYLEKQSMYSTL